MATADQILSLIRNHLNNDDTQFRKVALQISAVEARSGHAIVARTIQELLNQKKTSLGTIRLVSKNKDVDDLLLQVDTDEDMTSLVLSQKLGRIFDFISEVPAVYLFDEFDAIGSQRGMDNEVGEQRRILNTFLQLLERDDSDSFIIAATNSIESIDKAMFRRFDDVIEYKLPDGEQRLALLREYLYTAKDLDFSSAEPLFDGMSHAEIKMVCSDIFKESLLNDRKIDLPLVQTIVNMRQQLNRQTC